MSLGQTIVSGLEVISVSCALIHMVFISFGIFLSFLTLAFAGMALQRVRRDTAGKSFGAITGNQRISALFMNYVQMGRHIFFWFAYKLL